MILYTAIAVTLGMMATIGITAMGDCDPMTPAQRRVIDRLSHGGTFRAREDGWPPMRHRLTAEYPMQYGTELVIMDEVIGRGVSQRAAAKRLIGHLADRYINDMSLGRV